MKETTQNPGDTARAIVRTLRAAGHESYFAGGCVRDMLMGRPATDYDIATSATPEEIEAMFPGCLAVGRAFGVMTVQMDGHSFEVATFRRDLSYVDGRRPSGVTYSTVQEDARRRDFTINGMFYDPDSAEVIDYVGGREDLARRIVRTIGSPEDRFSEDYLRMLRAVRFATVLEFNIEPATMHAIQAHAPEIARVSAERIQQELTRLLLDAPRAGNGIRILQDVGLLQVILPEVAAMDGTMQPEQYHPEGDVLSHTILMLNEMEHRSLQLAYAVLLHDVGKPPTAKLVEDETGQQRIRFDGHASVGAEIGERILMRLRLPERDIEAITHCIANHMRFISVQDMRPSTLRRLVGAPTFPVELELHRLDCLCSNGLMENYEFLRKFIEQLGREPALPNRWVTGKDVVALGVPEGPHVGRWLAETYEAQLEGRFRNREAMLEWLKIELAREYHESERNRRRSSS